MHVCCGKLWASPRLRVLDRKGGEPIVLGVMRQFCRPWNARYKLWKFNISVHFERAGVISGTRSQSGMFSGGARSLIETCFGGATACNVKCFVATPLAK